MARTVKDRWSRTVKYRESWSILVEDYFLM